MRRTIAASIVVLVGAIPVAAAGPRQVSVTGTISVGSSLGLIENDTDAYTFSNGTKHLDRMFSACPTRMGQETRCKVRFTAAGISVLEIISAEPAKN